MYESKCRRTITRRLRHRTRLDARHCTRNSVGSDLGPAKLLYSFARWNAPSLAWLGFEPGLASLGSPQGNLRSEDFRRVSVSALRRTLAHAESDSLEHSVVFCHAALFHCFKLWPILFFRRTDRDLLVARCSRTLGRPWRWLRPLALRYLDRFATATRPRHRDVVLFLKNDFGFQRALREIFHELAVDQWLTSAAHAARRRSHILGHSCHRVRRGLGQLAGSRHGRTTVVRRSQRIGLQENSPQLRHYHYRILAKKFGSVR